MKPTRIGHIHDTSEQSSCKPNKQPKKRCLSANWDQLDIKATKAIAKAKNFSKWSKTPLRRNIQGTLLLEKFISQPTSD